MNDEVVLTVQQLADQEGVSYQTASGLLRYLRDKGVATDAGTVERGTGKGRAATAYRLPRWWTLTFGATVEQREAA